MHDDRGRCGRHFSELELGSFELELGQFGRKVLRCLDPYLARIDLRAAVERGQHEVGESDQNGDHDQLNDDERNGAPIDLRRRTGAITLAGNAIDRLATRRDAAQIEQRESRTADA